MQQIHATTTLDHKEFCASHAYLLALVCSAGLSECHQGSWQSHLGSSASIHHHAYDGFCCLALGGIADSICYWVSMSAVISCPTTKVHCLMAVCNAVCLVNVSSWSHCMVRCKVTNTRHYVIHATQQLVIRCIGFTMSRLSPLCYTLPHLLCFAYKT